MKQKILMLGWGYPPDIDGGLDVHVANLFEELEKLDVDVDLALPEERAPGQENIIPVETPSDEMTGMAHDLSRKIVELAENYDIIHTHDWFGSESGLKAKKYSDAKWVATFHSLSTGRSRNPSPRIKELERAAVERADRTLAVSEMLAEEVEKEYGEKPEVVHNGFKNAEATGKDVKEELGIGNEMIFFVGRHAEQKGVEHLIYAYSKLEREATLVIGGEGHLTDSLEDFVEMLGIEENVIFTGFIPREELGDYYASADVFVSPSINEPFGLTVTEAVEAGTPVVATRTGVEEILPSDAITSVKPDSGSIKRGIEKALETGAPGDFNSRSWKEVAEETLEIYRELNRQP